MKHHTETIAVTTTEHLQFIDITDRVRSACKRSGIRNGIANIFTTHTTTAVKVNERCDALQEDMRCFLDAFAPGECSYRHDRIACDGRKNTHSHIKSLMMGASESIPVAEGRLALGQWQSIFFIEFDGPRPTRSVSVSVMGE